MRSTSIAARCMCAKCILSRASGGIFMKRYVIGIIALAGAVAFAQRPSQEPQQTQQQEQGRGRGRGMTPEQREALAKQEALEKETPVLQYDAKELPLVVPNHTI